MWRDGPEASQLGKVVAGLDQATDLWFSTAADDKDP